jgi:hypothetical protein
LVQGEGLETSKRVVYSIHESSYAKMSEIGRIDDARGRRRRKGVDGLQVEER